MESLGDILRAARERQGRTLDELAAATRINKKFLVQFESNVRPNLPDTYYKAFLRSYVTELGLDPAILGTAEIPKPAPSVPVAGETVSASSGPQAIQPVSPVEGRPAAAPASASSAAPPTPPVKGNQTLILFAIIILAVGAMAAIFWLRRDRNDHPPAKEISFSDVVRERESTQVLSPPASVDTVLTGRPVPGRDSLTLEAVASDTVWVRVVADSMPAREIVLAPQGQARWRARYKFTLSVGNGRAVRFRLNGRQLGPLSAVAKPVSNITYSWGALDTARRDVTDPTPGVLPGPGIRQPAGTGTNATTGTVTPRGKRVDSTGPKSPKRKRP